MPIKVKCKECGKQLMLKDELAGKQGTCPSCGKPLAIPSLDAHKAPAAHPPEKKPAPHEQKPGEACRCPACGAPVPRAAVICVACGTNVVTGTRGATKVGHEKLVSFSTHLLRTLLRLGIAAAVVILIVLVVSKTRAAYKISDAVIANEREAVKTLKEIVEAQEKFKRRASVDQDGNGIGEYGLLAELVNEVRVRNPKAAFTARRGDLSFALSTGGKEGDGAARRWGYRFKMLLAASQEAAGDDKDLAGAPDEPGKALDGAVIGLQEKSFICYAWPETRYATGVHAFVVNESGRICATKMEVGAYEGDRGPEAGAAYAGTAHFGANPIEGKGSDGNTWFLVSDADSLSWRTSLLRGLLFDLRTPWFTPESVKNAKGIVAVEEKCREALARRDEAKQAEFQKNWQKAELLYTQALENIGKELWPEKTLTRRLETRRHGVRLVLEAGKLEGEKKWEEARSAYSSALHEVQNRLFVERRLAAIAAAQERQQSVQARAAVAEERDAAQRVSDAREFLGICEKFANPYCMWAACEFYLGSEDCKDLSDDLQKRKTRAEEAIKNGPPLRTSKGESFDVVHLKDKKTVIRGKVVGRDALHVKIQVEDDSGKTIKRLLSSREVGEIEKKEISSADINNERAGELYVGALKCYQEGRFPDALAALGKLKYHFSDAAVQSDEALRKSLAAGALGDKAPADDLSPAVLLRMSIDGGEQEMCVACFGRGRLVCPYCKGTGHRSELTTCAACNGSGKTECSVCRGTRVRQSNCMMCNVRGEIECPRCKGKGKIQPYAKCEACNGTGRTDERCPDCKGAGIDRKTQRPCQTCRGNGTLPCPQCGGKGERLADYEIACPECEGTGRVACPNCGGTGRGPTDAKCVKCNGNPKMPCPKCKGEGRIGQKLCPVCRGNRQVICEACKGTGKPICRACNGTGKEPCEACGGKGKVPMRCQHCDENHTIPCGYCGGTGKRPKR